MNYVITYAVAGGMTESKPVFDTTWGVVLGWLEETWKLVRSVGLYASIEVYAYETNELLLKTVLN